LGKAEQDLDPLAIQITQNPRKCAVFSLDSTQFFGSKSYKDLQFEIFFSKGSDFAGIPVGSVTQSALEIIYLL
jgi:hypothetical protein